MAVWHYNFYLQFDNFQNIQKNELLNNLYNLFNKKTINNNHIIVGNFDNNFLEVNFKNGEINNISGGFNLLILKRDFLNNLITILNNYNLIFKNNEDININLNVIDILEDIKKSNAFNYITNQELFFKNLEK